MRLLAVALALLSSDFPPEPIDPVSAHAMVLRGDAALFDVREEHEVAQGMAAPALWLATSRMEAAPDLLKAALANLPPHASAIFYCGSGKRAGRAAQAASVLGRRAYNMGGFAEWKARGLPTKAGPIPGS